GSSSAEQPTPTLPAWQTWLEANVPEVQRLKTPLTAEQWASLVDDFGERLVQDVLLAMQNHVGLTKKYTSANLTARDWRPKPTYPTLPNPFILMPVTPLPLLLPAVDLSDVEQATEQAGHDLEQTLLPLFLYCEKTQGRSELSEYQFRHLSLIRAALDAIAAYSNQVEQLLTATRTNVTSLNAQLHHVYSTDPQLTALAQQVDWEAIALSLLDRLRSPTASAASPLVVRLSQQPAFQHNLVRLDYPLEAAHRAAPGLPERAQPADALLSAQTAWAEMRHSWFNEDPNGLPTHFPTIAPHWSWLPDEVTLVTGWPGHGKSELMLQLMLTKSVYDNWKWALYVPENMPARRALN
nr:hypothetical protein [Tanacetum cinerariifolium]